MGMTEVNADRVPLRQRQALETRRAIAGAARSLFAERGYAAASIDLVAEEAGVAARTVYAIFGTKQAIPAAICEAWLVQAGRIATLFHGPASASLTRPHCPTAQFSLRPSES